MERKREMKGSSNDQLLMGAVGWGWGGVVGRERERDVGGGGGE